MRTSSSLLRRAAALAELTLAVGLVAGTVVGAGAAYSYLRHGFPLVALDVLRGAINRTAVLSLVLLALWSALFALAARRAARNAALDPRRRRPAGRPLSWVALLAVTAAAAAPFALVAAILANRHWGLRPADLATWAGLGPNLGLAAAAAAAVAVSAPLLGRWGHRRLLPADADSDSSSGDLTGDLSADGGPARLAALAGLVLVLNIGLLGYAALAPRSASYPNVVVLLVDALRADRLGLYGYSRNTTPELDRFAEDAVVFDQAIASSTFTKSSVASLLTGRHPYQHGVYWGDQRDRAGRITSDVLSADEETLAEVLAERGFLTAAWVQNSHLRPFMGFAQGFVDYRDQQGSIERIQRRFLAWLRGPARLESVFAYLHYIDLHDPYRPAPPYDTMFGSHSDVYRDVDFREWGAWLEAVHQGEIELSAADLAQLGAYYDGQLAAIDAQIGRLLDTLRRRGLYDDSLIVVTSDHGDAFMEHGRISHSATPYDELARVPLMIKLPANRHAGRRIAAQVRLIDLFPTILDALGIGHPSSELAGCGLLPLLRPAASADGTAEPPALPAECAIAVTEIAEGTGGDEPTVAVRTPGAKYIHRPGGRDELYDLVTDPAERHDLLAGLDLGPDGTPLAGLPAEALALARTARAVVAARGERQAERVVLDEKTIRELKALGYIE